VISFLFDLHVPVAVSNGLRLRGVDVLTAFEDASSKLEDVDLLARAAVLGRVLVTQDEDFLAIATAWLSADREFFGIIYAHQLRVGIGSFISDLELIAKAVTRSIFAITWSIFLFEVAIDCR